MSASTPERQEAQEPRPQYPELPPHVLERIGGYIGPGLRKRMAARRAALASASEERALTQQ
jgi:hypothetical protein